MARLIVEIDSSQVLATLDGIRARASNLGPTMEGVSQDLAEGLDENIDSITEPALSPAYAKRKAKTHPGKGFLRSSDALYESMKPGSSDVEAWAGPVGIVYARAQDQGDPEGNLPSRQYVYITQARADRIFETIASAVLGPLRDVARSA